MKQMYWRAGMILEYYYSSESWYRYWLLGRKKA